MPDVSTGEGLKLAISVARSLGLQRKGWASELGVSIGRRPHDKVVVDEDSRQGLWVQLGVDKLEAGGSPQR